MDFTHRFMKGQGWVRIDPQPSVTAEMVNTWSRRGLGHDALNRGICLVLITAGCQRGPESTDVLVETHEMFSLYRESRLEESK